MKKEWFEPGPDGESPFTCEFYRAWFAGVDTGVAIAAAFRALIAEDAAQEVTPPALQVGDVVRLEPCPEREGHVDTHLFVGRVDSIEKMADTWDIQAPCAWFTIPECTSGQGIWWPVSALTLIRRAGEAAPADAKDAEIAELRAEVERVTSTMNLFKGMRDQARAHSEQCEAERDAAFAGRDELQKDYDSLFDEAEAIRIERDALRARIDAGVRVYFPKPEESPSELNAGGKCYDASTEKWDRDTHTALLIDARPIDRDHIADPGKMVDDRTGKADRREIGCDASYEARIAVGRDHTREYQTEDIDCDGTIKCARSNNRRRTAGTIADRGKPCTPA